MAEFNQSVIDKTFALEGRYSPSRSDRGNYITPKGNWVKGDFPFYSPDGGAIIFIGSKYGVAAPTYSKYLGRPCTKTEMQNLTRETAADIYKKEYWNRNRLGYVHSQSLAVIIFDGIVNQGNWMDGEVQRILNAEFNESLTVDYGIGRKTIAAINRVNAYRLHDSIRTARIVRYRQLARKPGQDGYLTGWLNRMLAFPKLFGNDYAATMDAVNESTNAETSPSLTELYIATDEIGEMINDFLIRNTPLKNSADRDGRVTGKIIAALGAAVAVAAVVWFLGINLNG